MTASPSWQSFLAMMCEPCPAPRPESRPNAYSVASLAAQADHRRWRRGPHSDRRTHAIYREWSRQFDRLIDAIQYLMAVHYEIRADVQRFARRLTPGQVSVLDLVEWREHLITEWACALLEDRERQLRLNQWRISRRLTAC